MRKFSVYNLIGALTEYVKQGGKLPFFNTDEQKKQPPTDNDLNKTNNDATLKNVTEKSPLRTNNALLQAMKAHDDFVNKVKKDN